jgi:hypothetical protein
MCSCFDQVWHEELARIAQRWSDQCQASHDKCRKVGEYLLMTFILTLVRALVYVLP